MRTSKPVTVTLGEMQERVDARARSGSYASVSEVIWAGLRGARGCGRRWTRPGP